MQANLFLAEAVTSAILIPTLLRVCFALSLRTFLCVSNAAIPHSEMDASS
jgi:hypothetical protein